MLVEIKEEFKLGFYMNGSKYLFQNLTQEQLQMIYKNRRDLRHVFNLVEPKDIENKTIKSTKRKSK